MKRRADRARRTADRPSGRRRAADGQGIVEYGLILGGSTIVASHDASLLEQLGAKIHAM